MLTQNRSNPKSQGAAYREFSRRRYKELKAQSYNLREAEIVAKVIRQWDAMTIEQRNKFLEMKNETMVMLNVEPLSTPLKGDMAMMKGKTNQKTTIEKKVQKMEMMEGSGSQLMDQINVREFDESSASKGMKTKKIGLSKTKKNQEYISFFKSYFDRLLKEHPNWSARQITAIIKLLWRKRKLSHKKQSAKPMRLCKKLSGRVFFRNTKCLPADKARSMWKKLPMETKMMWSFKGMAEENKTGSNNSMKMTLRMAQGTPMQMNKFDFINTKMI